MKRKEKRRESNVSEQKSLHASLNLVHYTYSTKFLREERKARDGNWEVKELARPVVLDPYNRNLVPLLQYLFRPLK